MTIPEASATLVAYLRARCIDAIRARSKLDRIQDRWAARHLRFVAGASTYYRPFAKRPLSQWPILQKSEWMACFDDINTVGAGQVECEALARRCELTRDFSATWRGMTVGLSTGTSGSRGLFLASGQERSQWAGTLLGRLIRNPLRKVERIALALRSGSSLYDSVRFGRLSFRYFDPLRPWDLLCDELAQFSPTILVAPAQMLARLAAVADQLRPSRVISVAEVLDPLDRGRIEAAFGVRVEQIYQATEGLLGVTCEEGQIHLNEPYLIIEKEWIDAARTRFTPIITDLWRRAQPVIRYRMDDVLQVASPSCPCGRPSLAIAAVEGRRDDVLMLRGRRGVVPVFADQLARQIVMAVEGLEDFSVSEVAQGRWAIGLRPGPDPAAVLRLRHAIGEMSRALDACPPELTFSGQAPHQSGAKQRRIRGLGERRCAS